MRAFMFNKDMRSQTAETDAPMPNIAMLQGERKKSAHAGANACDSYFPHSALRTGPSIDSPWGLQSTGGPSDE